MFNNNIRVEAVPKRVFEFCRIVAQNPIQIKELQEKIAPLEIKSNSGVGTYFSCVRDAASELGLVTIDENNIVSFVGNKNVVKNLNEFRRYCNSVVWKNQYYYFYKIAVATLESNLDWLKYNSYTCTDVQAEVRNYVGDDNDLYKHLLGERFWLSFLGFGLFQESSNSICFLPNMYEALKDFIVISNVPNNQEMTIGQFVEYIGNNASVALTNAEKTHKFNFAMSSALRFLHDKKEIVLKRNSDSEEIWNLYPLQSHEFSSEITHIVIKGVK